MLTKASVILTDFTIATVLFLTLVVWAYTDEPQVQTHPTPMQIEES